VGYTSGLHTCKKISYKVKICKHPLDGDRVQCDVGKLRHTRLKQTSHALGGAKQLSLPHHDLLDPQPLFTPTVAELQHKSTQ